MKFEYQLFYLANKSKVDISVLSQTRSILQQSNFSLNQIPLFSAQPFLLPNYKLGVMRSEPDSYSIALKQEIQEFVDIIQLLELINYCIEEVKIVSKLRNVNRDSGVAIIQINEENLLVISHKQQLDLLSQLLDLKQKLTQPEQLTYVAFKPNPKFSIRQQQVKHSPLKRPVTFQEIDDHIDDFIDQTQPSQQTQQQQQQQYQMKQKPVKEPKEHKHHSSSKKHHSKHVQSQKESNNEISKTITDKNQMLKLLQEKLDKLEDSTSSVSDTKYEVNRQINKYHELLNHSPKRFQTESTNLINKQYDRQKNQNVRKQMFLPVFNQQHQLIIQKQLKSYQNYANTFDSRTLGPAWIRCRMSTDKIFEILCEEVFNDIYTETVFELTDMLKEVVMQ
ncbi:Hypothetical_protein [Hexamita inflata]|uniref:Hypothetical_protein n=1 Tax=Hexamita inflata TaxID=28002 RepID=A0AA86NM91_9EUKA|nr:Hypothetical protein HINF_LOCUS10527 [Hexamita inflata]